MRFEIETKIVINVESSNIMLVLVAFLNSLSPIFAELLGKVMLHFADEYGKNGRLGEILGLLEGETWHWKTKTGSRGITIKSLFGKIQLPNPVVEIKGVDGVIRKMVIGRKLLEVSAYQQIPDGMKTMIGTLGGLMSFRNVAKSMAVFSLFKISLSTIWKSLQWTAQRLKITFKEQGGQDECFETDGTGIPTQDSGKRGSEAKVLMQRKAGGGLRFLGAKVGSYKSKADWEALFAPVKAFLTKGKRFILLADGDDTPIQVWKKLTEGFSAYLQRCLWHIPHQLKYMLWMDKANKEQKKSILSLCYNAVLIRKNVSMEDFAEYIDLKIKRFENLIIACKNFGLCTSQTFLQNAKEFLFRVGRNAKDNHNTSLTERAMRTIKQRTRYAYWSQKGAENAINVRLNHFYNDPEIGLHLRT